tara:strand:+ start:361 stop:1338 length:978 start_codon:yes stop_codon:yes gene_type:complete
MLHKKLNLEGLGALLINLSGNQQFGIKSGARKMAKYSIFFGISVVVSIMLLSTWLAVSLVPNQGMQFYSTSLGTVAETVDLFKDRDFDIFKDFRKDTLQLPPILMTELPSDMTAVPDLNTRKAVFVAIVLPHILYSNSRIQNDRRRLMQLNRSHIQGRTLRGRDRKWLNGMAKVYHTQPTDIEELLWRVDIVPPRLALAQAAQESGWGTSRFSQTGNALFGQHAPVGKGAIRASGNAKIALKVFDSLQESVRDYMRNLNRNRAYQKFRELRMSMRTAGKPLDSIALAGSLGRYSEERKIYIKRLRALINLPEISATKGAKLVTSR